MNKGCSVFNQLYRNVHLISNESRLSSKHNSQIARNRCAWRGDSGGLRRSVLISLTEASRVDEAKRAGVVQKRVEDRPGVEERHLIQVTVPRLEGFDVGGQLTVVVVESL